MRVRVLPGAPAEGRIAVMRFPPVSLYLALLLGALALLCQHTWTRSRLLWPNEHRSWDYRGRHWAPDVIRA